MNRLIIPLAAAALLAGCDKPAETGNAAAPSSEAGGSALSEAAARKIITDAHAVFTAGDAVKILALYAPDAVVFDPGHVEPTTDRNVLLRWNTDFVGMKPADLTSNPAIVQVLDDSSIMASGIASFTADLGRGNRTVLRTRYSQLFERQPDGRWLIVHEHMSLPPEQPAGQ